MSMNLRSSSAAPRAQFIDPHALMRIKGLELRAKSVVHGFMSGLHRSPYHGFSVEFTEYRQYTPGEDTRHIDWRLYARSDRYYLKRYEDETNLRCHLLVDRSRSMGFGSTGFSKKDYANTLAATLAYFLQLQRDLAGLVTFEQHIVDYLPARFRPGHLRRLMLMLEKPVQGKGTDILAPLRQIADLVTKRGLMVLISDLLAPVEHLEAHLARLRVQGHEVVVFQVLDPQESSFAFDEPALFEDLESGRQVYIDPNVVRNEYLSRLATHNEKVRKACEQLGIEYHPLTTDRPLELALYDYLKGRQRFTRTVERRGQMTRGGRR